MQSIRFPSEINGPLWMEESAKQVIFHSGDFDPERPGATNDLRQLAKRVHLLINCPFEGTPSLFFTQLGRALAKLIPSEPFSLEPYRALQGLQNLPSHSVQNPSCPDFLKPSLVPPFFLKMPSWEEVLPQTQGNDSIRYCNLGNYTHFVLIRNDKQLSYGILYRDDYLQSLIKMRSKNYVSLEKLFESGWYEYLSLLPNLSDWKQAEDPLSWPLLKNSGKCLDQWDEYYTHWIRLHWDSQEIYRRFWSVLTQAEKQPAHEPGIFGNWLIRLLLPLVANMPDSEKTDAHFSLLMNRLGDRHYSWNNPNYLILISSWLKEPRFAQSDGAVCHLKSSENLEVLALLLRHGTRDRDLSLTHANAAECNSSSALKRLLRMATGAIYHKHESLFLECLAALASQTASEEFKFSRKETYFDDIYNASSALSPNFRLKAVALLIYYGTPLSLRQLDYLKQDFERGETALVPLMQAKGYLTADEANSYRVAYSEKDAWDQCSPIELEALLLRNLASLERMAQRSNLAHDAIDYEKLSLWRCLKKEAKKKKVLSATAQKFCTLYDRLIQNHPFLSLLREVSVEIRAVQRKRLAIPKQKIATFLGIWAQKDSSRYSPIDARHLIDQTPELFDKVRLRMVPLASRYFADPIWYGCRNLWVHGSKSSVHVMMQKMASKALMTVNSLLRLGIVPPCGEFCGSHEGGINQDGLSGEMPAGSWETAINPIFKTPGNFPVSINYATKEIQYNHDLVFDPATSWELVKREHVEQTLNGTSSTDRLKVRIAILRLRMTDREADAKLTSLKEWLHTQKVAHPQKTKPLLDALEEPQKIFLEKEDLEKVIHPYPILFGCPDQTPIQVRVEQNKGIEFISRDKLALGQDIQMVFARSSHVAQLRKDFSGMDVHVEEFDMALFIETMEMTRGSAANPEILRSKSPADAQVKLDTLLQQTVLPRYAARLPKNPPKRTLKKHFTPKHPTFADYKKHLGQGGLARDFHGPMHAARTTFWSQILAMLYKNAGNLVLLGLTSADHDSDRRWEWEDLDEKGSSLNVKADLKRLELPVDVAERYVRAVAVKDPPDKVYVDPVQEIVHNADCFEIIRCLKSIAQFDRSYLSFTHLQVPLTEEYLTKFIEEAAAFIKQTEDEELKKRFERESSHHYLDLLRLFKKIHEEQNCYPTIYALAKDFLPEDRDKPL